MICVTDMLRTFIINIINSAILEQTQGAPAWLLSVITWENLNLASTLRSSSRSRFVDAALSKCSNRKNYDNAPNYQWCITGALGATNPEHVRSRPLKFQPFVNFDTCNFPQRERQGLGFFLLPLLSTATPGFQALFFLNNSRFHPPRGNYYGSFPIWSKFVMKNLSKWKRRVCRSGIMILFVTLRRIVLFLWWFPFYCGISRRNNERRWGKLINVDEPRAFLAQTSSPKKNILPSFNNNNNNKLQHLGRIYLSRFSDGHPSEH